MVELLEATARCSGCVESGGQGPYCFSVCPGRNPSSYRCRQEQRSDPPDSPCLQTQVIGAVKDPYSQHLRLLLQVPELGNVSHVC